MKRKSIAILLVIVLLMASSVGVWASDDVETAPPAPEEYGRYNPAPVGTAQTYHYTSRIWEHIATVTIDSVERGESAWEKIHAANMFNAPPPGGMEYILVHATVDVHYSRNYMHFYFSENSFTLFSDIDMEYKIFYRSTIFPGEMFRGEVFPGGTLEGYAAFLVSKGDAHTKARFCANPYTDEGGVWFSLG